MLLGGFLQGQQICTLEVVVVKWMQASRLCWVLGVRSYSQLEGLCHAIQGGSDWFSLEKFKRFRTKSTLSDKLAEGTEKFVPLTSVESVKIGVIPDANGLQVSLKPFPRVKLLLWSSFDHSSVSGRERSSKVTQETISFGSGWIFKPNGTWSGKWLESKWHKWSDLMWKSLDKESQIELLSPDNHWL